MFVFIKHPFDVGDRVGIDGNAYVVKEINLLSTVFLDSKNVSMQALNLGLNNKVSGLFSDLGRCRAYRAPSSLFEIIGEAPRFASPIPFFALCSQSHGCRSLFNSKSPTQ